MLHLGAAGSGQTVLFRLVEHLAAVVRNGDVAFVQTFHGHEHHVEDGVDFFLVGFAVGIGQFEHHGGRGGLALLHKKAALGDDQVHAGALHAGEFADGARKFALKRAGVVDFLHKVGLAHLDLVENFKADALPHQAAFAGDLDALVVDHFPGHHDGGPVVGQLIGNLVGLQRLDHVAGVFRAQIGIEHAVFRPAQPDREADDGGQQRHRAAGHGHALDHAHSAPESLDDVHKIRKESGHDVSPGLVSVLSAKGRMLHSDSNCHAIL